MGSFMTGSTLSGAARFPKGRFDHRTKRTSRAILGVSAAPGGPMPFRRILAAAILMSTTATAAVVEWGPDRTGPVLEKTLTLRLAPTLDALGPGERKALDAL